MLVGRNGAGVARCHVGGVTIVGRDGNGDVLAVPGRELSAAPPAVGPAEQPEAAVKSAMIEAAVKLVLNVRWPSILDPQTHRPESVLTLTPMPARDRRTGRGDAH
jgi:hypothetical protein